MCDPFTAAIIASFGSSALGAAGSASAKKANARAMDQDTQRSAGEFNIRDQLAKDIFTENTGISRQVYDELNSLSDQEFAARTGLSKDTFNKLTDIERESIVRDAAAADTNIAAGRDATGIRNAAQDTAIAERNTGRDSAKAAYDATAAAANKKQDAFRGQADTEAGNLLAAFTPGAMQGRQAAATTGRDALVAQSMTGGSTAPAGRIDPNIAAAFARESTRGRDEATKRSTALSKVAGYTDAMDQGDRSINSTNQNVGFIKDAAQRALTPLAAQLGVSSLQYRNAGDRGAERFDAADARHRGVTGAADADLEAALGLSRTRAAGETRPVTTYSGAMDDAMAAFYGDRTTSAANRGDTLIGANNTKLAGSNSVSNALEGNLRSIAAFRAANRGTPLATTLGQFSGAIAPTLFNQAAQDGNLFGKPKPATVK